MRTSLENLTTTVEQVCRTGHIRVLRCHPLRFEDGRPALFPTLFWLACPDLDRQLSELERAGWIARIQQQIESDDALQAQVRADHLAYIAERWRMLSATEQATVRTHGLEENLLRRGIGGILDFKSVKCLQLHYAHRLVSNNTIGELLEQEGLLVPCGAP